MPIVGFIEMYGVVTAADISSGNDDMIELFRRRDSVGTVRSSVDDSVLRGDGATNNAVASQFIAKSNGAILALLRLVSVGCGNESPLYEGEGLLFVWCKVDG